MFKLVKSIALMILICADNMSKTYFELDVKTVLKINMTMIFKLNSYIVLLDILLMKFLALLRLN